MDKNKTDSWKAYASYNNILRTWFVAFGVGVPAMFLVNVGLAGHIHDHPNIFIVFLLGAAAQVVIAFLNKIISWCVNYNYKYVDESGPKGFWQHLTCFGGRFKNWFWLDILCDLTTICCFAWAIYSLLEVVISSSCSTSTIDVIDGSG